MRPTDKWKPIALRPALACACAIVSFSLYASIEVQGNAQESRLRKDQQVRRYLQKLNLDQLAVQQLEDELKVADARVRPELALELATIYTAQIRNEVRGQIAQTGQGTTSSAAVEAVRKKLAKLTDEFDELNHPKFATALISIEFSRNQNAFFVWAGNRDGTETPKKLSNQFKQLGETWSEEYKNVQSRIDEYNRKVDNRIETSELRNRIDELTAIRSQLEFIGGWLCYYEGILDPSNRRRKMLDARELFLDLLQLGSDVQFADLDADELELEVDWFSRSLIGIGCASLATGNVREQEQIFGLLQNAKVSPLVRAELDWWAFQGAAFVNNWDRAKELAQRKLESSSKQPPSRETARFWLTMANTSFASKDAPQAIVIRLIAYQGLARENQFNVIDELNRKHKYTLPEGSFVDDWLKGYQAYTKAEETDDLETYVKAKSFIESAINSKSKNVGRIDLAQLRYLLAWIELRQKQFEPAAKKFRQASLGLRNFDRETAAKALWIRIVALRNLDQNDPAEVRRLNSALNEIVRLFPESIYAEKASFELTRLRFAKSDPLEAVKRLEKLPEENTNFAAAQFEIVRLYYQYLNGAGKTSQDREQTEDAFVAFGRRTVQQEKVSAENRAKSTTLYVDYWLSTNPPQLNQAKEWNRIGLNMIGKLGPGSDIISDIRFQTFRIAKQENDARLIESEARWLAGPLNRNRNYKSAALIYLAKDYDDRVADANADEREQILNKTIELYSNLCRFLGQSKSNLQQSSNARIAFARLADLQAMKGDIEPAIAKFEILHQVQPRKESYLLRLAQLMTQNGNREQAMIYWRKIASGSKAGSPTWLEAKYQIILHLAKSDPQQAKSVLRQTVKLVPGLNQEWTDRFKKLENEIE